MDMSVAMANWFAQRLEKVIDSAIKSRSQEIVSFCRREVYPIYHSAIGETQGRLVNKFIKNKRELAFESQNEIELMMEVSV